MLEKILDNLDYIFAPIGAICGWFFGKADGFIYALISLCFMDYITGDLEAAMEGKLSSSVGFKGIAKKITIFILVGIAHVVDKQMLGNTALLRDGVIFFYLANEGISILENAIKIGIPVPDVLKNALAKLERQHNEKHEK